MTWNRQGQNFAAAGLSNPAKLASDFASMCSSEMDPAIRPLIQIHQFEGERVVVAEIPELDPAHRPCFYIGAGMTKGSFVRVSDGDRRLSAYEVQLMLSSRGQPRDDEPELAALTGLSDPTVRRWLTIMRDEGTVELAGNQPRSKKARYRRTRQQTLFPQNATGRQ
ncbi:hypothetical protein HH310_04845 [Actinoplanes sp. TBRC 11911]|uniref:AlbA family DNA-binding domain-containing protein n=1 Tax=Actinoplanes sp. TBRC 11911 TaxID=2729386 RepID=UPI00145F72DB|nr:hypothetical protein [Actinoplanes sp. TBRC 11911]NMO50520.1 hypothetical protein [Actinoplanes sp. TBRC 11911]